MSAVALVGRTFSRWNDHEGQRLGAALAFYTLLSAAPLLVFILLAVSAFYGRGAVEQKIVHVTQTMMGQTAADVARGLLENAHRPNHTALAGAIALFTLIFGASGAFSELRDDLNKMWDAHASRRGIFGIVIQRAFAFLLVIAVGVLMIVLMLASAATELISQFFQSILPVPPFALNIGNFVISFVAITVVMVLIYRFVPDLVLPWKVLWTGAAVSAVLFVIGKALIGIYLAKAGVGSAYGAAGSLIAIAFWVYYSAQIFLLGAEFTYVWSGRGAPPQERRRAA